MCLHCQSKCQNVIKTVENGEHVYSCIVETAMSHWLSGYEAFLEQVAFLFFSLFFSTIKIAFKKALD